MYCFRTIQMEKVRKLETGSEYMLNVEWTRVLLEEVWIEREGKWSIWSCYGDPPAITLLNQESSTQHP